MVLMSFPTIILVDAEGKVLGKAGYRRGGPEPYVEYLKSLLVNKAYSRRWSYWILCLSSAYFSLL